MVCTACLVCFNSTANGCNNKKRKKKVEAYPLKAGASRGHITNLKQSILETFNIYGILLGFQALPMWCPTIDIYLDVMAR